MEVEGENAVIGWCPIYENREERLLVVGKGEVAKGNLLTEGHGRDSGETRSPSIILVYLQCVDSLTFRKHGEARIHGRLRDR